MHLQWVSKILWSVWVQTSLVMWFGTEMGDRN